MTTDRSRVSTGGAVSQRRRALVRLAGLLPAALLVLTDARPAAAAPGQVTFVSHTAASPVTTGGGGWRDPETSADGSYVLFTSEATNLVPGQRDTNGSNDVFLFRVS